jgi:AsnC-type helix-turn-helix domain
MFSQLLINFLLISLRFLKYITMTVPSPNQAINDLDRIDLKILQALQTDGRLTNAKLADTVGLSPSAVLARTQRLQRDHYILGYAVMEEVKETSRLPI